MSLGSYGRLLVKICDWDVSSFNMFHVFRGISPSFSTSILIILHQLFDWKYLAPVDVSFLRFHLGGIRCDWCLHDGFGIHPVASGRESRFSDLWFPLIKGGTTFGGSGISLETRLP